jgi:hypothetical protein
MIPHHEFTINDVIKSFYMTESGFITEKHRIRAIEEQSDSVFLNGLEQETLEKKVPNIKGIKEKLIEYIIKKEGSVIDLLRDEQIRASNSKKYLSIFHYNTIWSKIGYTNRYIVDLCRYKKKTLLDCIKQYAQKYNLNLSIGVMPSLDEVIRQYFEFSVKIVEANNRGDKRFLISNNIILEEDEILQSYTKRGILPTSLLLPFSIARLRPRLQLSGTRVVIPEIPRDYNIDISRIKPWIKGYKKSYIVTNHPFCFSADCLHILSTVNSHDFNFNYIYRFQDDIKITPEHVIIKLMASTDIRGREYKWIRLLKKDKLDAEIDKSKVFILSKDNIVLDRDETGRDDAGEDISRELNINALFTYEVNDIIEREVISNAVLNLNVHPASLKVPEQAPISSPHPAYDPLIFNQWRFKSLTFFVVHLTESGYIFGDNELKMKEVEWYKRYNEPFVMRKNCLFNFEKARAIEKKVWLYPTWYKSTLIKQGHNSNTLKINDEIIGSRNSGENEFAPTDTFNHILYGNTRLCHKYKEGKIFLYIGRGNYYVIDDIKYYLHESRYMERNLQIHNQENKWFDLNLGEHYCKLLAEDIKTSKHTWTLRFLCLLTLQKALQSCVFYYNKKKNISNDTIVTFENNIFQQLKKFKVIDYLETVTKFILVFNPNPSLSLFSNKVLVRGDINWIPMDIPLETIYPELFSNNRVTSSQREQFRIDFSIASNQFIKNVAKVCYDEGDITSKDTDDEKLRDTLENKITNKKLIKLLEKVDTVSTPRVSEIVIKLNSGEEINIDYSSYHTIFSQSNLVKEMEKLGDDIMSELGLTQEQKRSEPPTPEQKRSEPPTPEQKRSEPEQKRSVSSTPEQKIDLITDLDNINRQLTSLREKFRINKKFKNSVSVLQGLDMLDDEKKQEINSILSGSGVVVSRIESIILKLRSYKLSDKDILTIVNHIIS